MLFILKHLSAGKEKREVKKMKKNEKLLLKKMNMKQQREVAAQLEDVLDSLLSLEEKLCSAPDNSEWLSLQAQLEKREHELKFKHKMLCEEWTAL